MSLDASRWAWKQQLKPASLKLVLLSLADRADAKHQSFPSKKLLALDTGLDIKTVEKCIKQLQSSGVIEDTGKKRGRTGSVTLWQLVGVVGRHDSEDKKEIKHSVNVRKKATPKTGYLGSTPKNGVGSYPKNGVSKLPQKRGIEPISINLSVEPPPVVPQGDAVEEKEVPPKPPPFSNEFAYAVLEKFNAVANRPENIRNWCAHPKLTLANQLAMKELYNHHEMNSLDVWVEYFDAMAGSKFVKSMRAVGLKFALKEDTLMNTESGMYNKLDLPNG